MVKMIDSQLRRPVFKPRGGSTVDSAFHPSEIDKMSRSHFWQLSGKKMPPRSGSVCSS